MMVSNDGNDEGVVLTDDGEQDGEEEGGQADPLARPAAGVDVVLQWEHDGHQPGYSAQEKEISYHNLITMMPLPVNTGQHVRQQQQVSVPNQQIEKQNMG